MTVGLPRSGKSTWARMQEIPIVEPDAIRLALYGQAYIASAERHVWAITRTMVEALFLAGHDNVILSATSLRRAHRDMWKSDKWERTFISFSETAATCIERAMRNGREDLIPVIERMAEETEALDRDELNDHLRELDEQG